MKEMKAPKLFLTTAPVVCFMFNGFMRNPNHILGAGLEYSTTNCKFMEDGSLFFELHDSDGWIGDYKIYSNQLEKIKIIL